MCYVESGLYYIIVDAILGSILGWRVRCVGLMWLLLLVGPRSFEWCMLRFVGKHLVPKRYVLG